MSTVATQLLCRKGTDLKSHNSVNSYDLRSVPFVRVDRLEGDLVCVRDPWGLFGPGSGTGTQATIKLSDFMDHWHWAINNVVFPNRVK